MFSIESLCLNSVSQNRDSFSERICDDLCEVILQYLSLKDKLRVKCVSKKFQRTIFQKQYELTIDPNVNKNIEVFSSINQCFDLKAIEILLKKCPNIKFINLLRIPHMFNYNEFIDLIIKYCNNLVEFKAPLSQMSEDVFNEFAKKFRTKLKVLTCSNYETDSNPETGNSKLLNSFPVLKELEINNCPEVEPDRILSKLNGIRLVKLSIRYFNQQLPFSESLFDNCFDVRELNMVCVNGPPSVPFDIRFMENISKLKNLIHLKVDAFIRLDEEINIKSFKQFANNCRNLKSIECGFDMNWRKGSQWRLLLSLLKDFKQLKRLKLNITHLDQIEQDDVEDPLFFFDYFEGLSSLTHLTLQIPLLESISETVLKNIDIYLPNLQYFEMSSLLVITPEGQTQVADMLSRLPKLETIKLLVNNKMNKETLVEELVRKFKKLRNILIEW